MHCPSATRYFRLLMAIVVLLALASCFASGGNADDVDELRVRVGFLFSFAKFTNWPEAGSSKSFRIGVVGDAAFVEALHSMLSARTVRNLPIKILEAEKAEESSLEGFVRQGGMVELFLKDNRMRFAMNRKAIEASTLRISPELQELASLR
jgi:hypothetical protein